MSIIPSVSITRLHMSNAQDGFPGLSQSFLADCVDKLGETREQALARRQELCSRRCTQINADHLRASAVPFLSSHDAAARPPAAFASHISALPARSRVPRMPTPAATEVAIIYQAGAVGTPLTAIRSRLPASPACAPHGPRAPQPAARRTATSPARRSPPGLPAPPAAHRTAAQTSPGR